MQRIDELCSDTVLTVSFANIATENNGGSPVISLNLYFKPEGGDWTSLIGEISDSLAESHSVAALTPGANYKFKYRASNIFGNGEFSAEATLKAATRPD